MDSIRSLLISARRASAAINRLSSETIDKVIRDVADAVDKYIPVILTANSLDLGMSKVATLRISPREVVQLKNALLSVAPIKTICQASDLDALKSIGDQLNACEAISSKIENTVVNEAPNAVNRGTVIRQGVDAELDELREIAGR